MRRRELDELGSHVAVDEQNNIVGEVGEWLVC